MFIQAINGDPHCINILSSLQMECAPWVPSKRETVVQNV